MNKKQLTVLWIGIAVFVLVALTTQTNFSTWHSDHGRGPAPRYPTGPTGRYVSVVNYGPLVGRLMSTVVVTGGLIYTLKDKKDEKPKDEKKQ